MKPVSLLLSLFFAASAFSQTSDSLLRKYDRQFITRYGGYFLKDNQHLSFRDLQAEFDQSALGLEFYMKAKRHRSIAQVFSILSLGAAVGTIAGASNNNRTTTFTFLGAQLVSILISGSFSRRSALETDRALQVRNRELLFPGR